MAIQNDDRYPILTNLIDDLTNLRNSYVGALKDNVDGEVIAARKGYDLLGYRLDGIDSSLADILNQRNIVNALKPLNGLDGLNGDGIMDNTTVLQNLINYCSDNKLILFIPPGVYKITSQIMLGTYTNIIGMSKKDTIILVDDDFTFSTPSSIRIFTTQEKYNTVQHEVHMSNITIKVDTKTKVVFTGDNEGFIAWLYNVKNSDFKNCDFLVENNGISNKITPIWLRDGCDDILFEKCCFKTDTANDVGGCIWIWALSSGRYIGNIKIKDCIFEHNAGDEAIAIYGEGKIYNVTIENNTFYLNTVNGAQGGLSYHNYSTIANEEDRFCKIKYINNRIVINGLYKNVFNLYPGVSSTTDFEILGNTIIYNNLSSTGFAFESVFKLIGEIIPGETELSLRSRVKSFKIKGNTVINKYNTLGQVLINKDCFVEFTDNKVYLNTPSYTLTYGYSSTLSETIFRGNTIYTKQAIMLGQTLEGKAIIDSNNINIINDGTYKNVLQLTKNPGYTGSGDGIEVTFSNNVVKGVKCNIIDATVKADVIITGNIFKFTNIKIYNNVSFGCTFKKFIINDNEFTVSSGTLDPISTTITNTNRSCRNNTVNGISLETDTALPTDTIRQKLFANGQVVFNLSDSTPTGWRKVSDSKWNII
jgi:hypothetical protein